MWFFFFKKECFLRNRLILCWWICSPDSLLSSKHLQTCSIIHGTVITGLPWGRKNWGSFDPQSWWKYVPRKEYLSLCQSFSPFFPNLAYSHTWGQISELADLFSVSSQYPKLIFEGFSMQLKIHSFPLLIWYQELFLANPLKIMSILDIFMYSKWQCKWFCSVLKIFSYSVVFILCILLMMH